MIKRITVVLLFIVMMVLLCGCNQRLFDTRVDYTKAYIRMNEKTIIVDVEAYTSISEGVLIIHGADGTTYRTHSVNVVLIRDSDGR